MESRLQTLRKWFPLFLISALSLFFEIAVIRWLSSEIRLLAYFKNLILLAAFLGLAIGFSIVRKKQDIRFSFPFIWAVFASIVIGFIVIGVGQYIFFPGSADEHFWFASANTDWLAMLIFIITILLFFLICMFLFIPLGQAVGKEMTRFPPVPAYIVNILASLAGIWLFSLLSYLQTPPYIWFGLGIVGIAGYFYMLGKLSRLTILVFTISILGIGLSNGSTIWSPYNRLSLIKEESRNPDILFGYILEVQQAFYQRGYNLSSEFIKEVETIEGERQYSKKSREIQAAYNLPFELAEPGSKVLIVGSGMGNDVAAALRQDMGDIVAVDIDPKILQLGMEFHPEKPYQDPRVINVTDDARSYINTTSEKFDLVVFGLLDSHILLSSLSSVRLDSYVYTIQSFERVQEILDEQGIVSITFATNEWIRERLGRMMSHVFGEGEVFYTDTVNGSTFVAGKVRSELLEAQELKPWISDPAFEDLPLTTDDWPYLYLRGRNIPSGYVETLLVIAVICLAIIARSYPEALKPDWHFWLLGAAFLLIEFKAITELALLFGTTWFVNSLAISGVLLMALGANLFVLKARKVHLGWTYVLLFGSLALGQLIPLDTFAELPGVLKALASTLLLSLPLLFAGVIFSESLRQAGETTRPLASNFSGSAVGGLLEYGSLLWGIKSLYWMSIFLYLGAFLIARVRKMF